MATEQELVDLNGLVYGVDHNYKEDGKTYPDINKGEIIDVIGKKFQVLSTSNNDKSGTIILHEPQPNGGYKDVPYTVKPNDGFSGMAVAPINNGVVDYGNVTVIAAATNPTSPNDLGGAAAAVPGLSLQYDTAEQYLLKLMKEHPDWQINQLSGYSQSAYMLKIGAKYHIPTTVFHGWFNYNTLTKEEREYMNAHMAQYINYRAHEEEVFKKLVVNHDAKNTAGSVYYIGGVNSHLRGSFKFDKDGNIKFNIEDSKGEDKISNLQGSIAKSSGGKKIALRTELIATVSEHAKDLAQGYESAIKAELEKAELEIKTIVQEINQGAYEIQNYLQGWEVDKLIQNYQESDFWDDGLESSIKQEVKKYKNSLYDFSDTLTVVSRRIADYDSQEGARLFKQDITARGKVR
ncbi:hypothetical protein FACS1894193_12310 [Bacilli bacterium]|nr:hypothetical protein FACS1894193_12310 [Bacilli bacterium]